MADRGKWTFKENEAGNLVLVDYVEPVKPLTPTIIFDDMMPTISNYDGKVYTSRRKLRQSYARAGVTEVGDQIEALHKMAEKPDPFKDEEYQKQLKEDIEKARNQLRYGDAPLSEEEREICKRRDEAIMKDGS